jgi:hypothetical protein
MRYLGSTKNLAGSAAGLLGVVLYLVGVLGSYWPIVVVALYAAGALLAPPERRVRLLPLSSSEETSQLRKDLATLLTQADSHTNRMPSGAPETVDRIGEILTGILDRPTQLTGNPEILHSVIRLAREDLPTSVQTYLNLPHRLPNRKATDHFTTQLALLEKEANRIAEAFYDKDIQQQANHTTYLQSRDETPS